MINFIKKNYNYLLLFIFIFCLYTFIAYPLLYADPTATYAFSKAMKMGEIPYLDFNIISTPLYSFLLSLGLHIWDNFSMILLEQSILVTIMYYLINRIYGNSKGCILLLATCLLGFFCLNPTYNFMAIFMLVLILFFEKEKSDKDYLIGILIGLAILSKHTVCGFFIIPSIIYYFKDKKKLLKRFIGVLGVGLIFIIYLLLTNSFNEFFDLCILGLFDFSSNNSHPTSIYFYISIVLFIISLIITIKNRKDISNYYLLFTIAIAIPIFDVHHYSYYFFCFVMQLLPLIKKYELEISRSCFSLFLVIFIFFGASVLASSEQVFNKKINHYQYIFNDKECYKNYLDVFELFDEYDDALIISNYKMLYDISRDNKIDYFDVPLYGNAGYDGSKKMIDRIKKMHDKYIIIDVFNYGEKNPFSQFDESLIKYVINNCEKIKEKGDFIIYYKK